MTVVPRDLTRVEMSAAWKDELTAALRVVLKALLWVGKMDC